MLHAPPIVRLLTEKIITTSPADLTNVKKKIVKILMSGINLLKYSFNKASK